MAKALRLRDFCRYVSEQWQAIRQVYAEIEEVQYQFNTIYAEKVESWQAAISQAAPMLLSASDLPPALAQSLLEATAEERTRLEKEIADLTAQVEASRREADSTLSEAQDELRSLRRMNPQLDAREEEIKARCATIRQEIQELEAAIRSESWLSGFFARRRLRQRRDERRRALAAGIVELRQVRQAWEDEKQRFQASQSRLNSEWETASIQAAQLQARLDFLQGNLERLTRENGATRFLEELQAVPDETPQPLRQALVELAELNRLKAGYEEGLRTVAEALGLLKGLAEGMERFSRSADKVLEEQRVYDLPELRVQLDDGVLAFHALWPKLRNLVADEKALGAQPVEFSRIVHGSMERSLPEEAIAATFEDMGQALTRATRAWD